MKHLIPLAGLVLFFVTQAHAADNVYLSLKSNGTDIQGESSVTSLGRANTIECFSYEQNSEMVGGKRQYTPLIIVKRLDKSSPLLFKAMVENANLNATFRFFRPNPTGDGTTEQFYTVTLSGARITSIRQSLPDTRDKTNAAFAPAEEVAFTFSKISWTYNNGGITFEDGSPQVASSVPAPANLNRPLLRIPVLPK